VTVPVTTPAYPASSTPYITPDQLTAGLWPVAVDWSTLPPGTNVTQSQKQAALAEVCLVASADINGYLNYPLRAVLNTEQQQGPDFRITVRNSTKEARVILSRWPITQIVSVQVAPAGVYPIQWTTVPSGFYRPEFPVIGRPDASTPSGSGEGGQAILIAPGYVNWCNGRWGTIVSVQYYHGWPHSSLTAAASAGDTTIQVGDVTSWAPLTAGQPGAEGIIYDTTAGQEPISVTAASPTTGTGTLTLASPLAYGHASGVMVSSLPSNVHWAAAELAGAQALTRGAQAMVNAAAPGRAAGGNAKADLKAHAFSILSTYKKVW
jgi:hypothetical protein